MVLCRNGATGQASTDDPAVPAYLRHMTPLIRLRAGAKRIGMRALKAVYLQLPLQRSTRSAQVMASNWSASAASMSVPECGISASLHWYWELT